MLMKVGVSTEQGFTSLLVGDDIYSNHLRSEEREANAFSRDGWTAKADIKTKTLTVQRPKVGKCPAATETFALQDGTLYLKAKQKVAEAKFASEDLSVMIWEKYGIHEICHANPNRTYPFRFREDLRATTDEEKETGFRLVWTHTDGAVSTIKHEREQRIEQDVRYGRLNQFVGNVKGLYVEQTVKHTDRIDKNPITMMDAVKAFNGGDENSLAVDNANFTVIFAMNPAYQIMNHFCVLYTTEKDHRKIIEMLDKKLASDRQLNIRGFNLRDLAHDYWEY